MYQFVTGPPFGGLARKLATLGLVPILTLALLLPADEVGAQATGTVSTGTGTRDDVEQLYFSVTGPDGTVTYPAEDGRAWIMLPEQGSYTIDAVAVDEAGNQASQSATVEVGASSSVVTVTDPVNSGAVSGTGLSVIRRQS